MEQLLDVLTGVTGTTKLLQAVRVGGVTEMIIFKIDVLTDIFPIHTALACDLDSRRSYPYEGFSGHLLVRAESVYKEILSW